MVGIVCHCSLRAGSFFFLGGGGGKIKFSLSCPKNEPARRLVSLPPKEPHEFLPDNYKLNLVRLNSIVKRLKRDPGTVKEYNRIIEEQLDC